VDTILLTVAYDGRPFSGWAPQRNARTVAGELLGALQAVDPAIREVRGTSRTDAGVHARGQLAAFDPARSISPRGWALAASQHLPDEIAIRGAARVAPGTNPRFESVRKRYRYLVLRDPVRDPFWIGRALRVVYPVETARARAELAAIVGTHDFTAFRSSGDVRADTTRTIDRAELFELPEDPRILVFEVVGSAFLYNMVRILAGTLVDVGRGRLPPGAMARALASKRRGDLGFTAPPDGLYLEQIEHRMALDDAWPAAPRG
jgi:tRNA pseudouridine38-40 synthase